MLPPSLHAQEPAVVHYKIEDGLLSNTIYDLFQDKNGFMWIATDKGVNRFDSYKMQSLTINDGLTDNDILSIHQDRNDRIWFLSYNGKLSYWINGKIYNSLNDSLLKGAVSKSFFRCFLEDQTGNLWFGTNKDALFKIDTSKKVEHIQNRADIDKTSLKSVYHLFETTDGNIYLVNRRHVFKLVDDQIHLHSSYPFAFNQGRFCYDKKTGILYASTQNKIYAFLLGSSEIAWQRMIPNAIKIHGIKILSDGLLYVATDHGIFSFNAEGSKRRSFLEGKNISDILIDKEGNLWASTLYNGVFLIRNREVLNYPTEAKFSILQYGDSILFGGAESKLHYLHKGDLYPFPIHTKKPFIKQNRIRVLAKDFHDHIWLGTDDGVYKLNRNKARPNLYLDVKEFIFHNNELFIASGDKLIRLDPSVLESNFQLYENNIESAYTKLTKTIIEKHLVYDQRVSCLSSIKNGTFLAGTEEGILTYKDSRLSSYLNFPGNNVVAIEQSSTNDLWILEQTKGLYYYQADKNELKNIKSLSNENEIIYSSLALDNDNLWVGTNKGLFYVKEEKGNFIVRRINNGYGLANEQINDVSIIRDTLWLATSNGIMSLPVEGHSENVPPLLFIDSVQIGENSISHEETLNLFSDNNTLSIYVSGILFKDQGKLTFEYHLEGKDSTFGSFTDRVLILSDLPPSNYTLSIYAVNLNGVKSEAKKVYFNIHTVWWKDSRLWFVTIAIIVLIAVLVFKSLLRKRVKEVESTFEKTKDKYITVKSAMNGGATKVPLKELIYVQASGDYMELFQVKKKILVRTSMKELMRELQTAPEFVRVHKSYLVNLEKIDVYKYDSIEVVDKVIPIGRTFRTKLKEHYFSLKKGS